MEIKKNVNFVIITLVYRNTKDLKEFIESVEKNIDNYKIIVVNAFYDKETEREVNEISKKYNCDFMSIENKGYSYGNNIGIKYANENYNFKYLIVSNPDIIIKRFELNKEQYGDILAPKIIAADGRNQNPMIIKENKIAEKALYNGFKKEKKILVYVGIILNKLNRIKFLMFNNLKKKKINKIFAAHGSFLIFSYNALKVLNFSPYDEKMFLFGEESVLGVKAEKNNLVTVFTPSIICYHKEDGSMKLSDISLKSELAKSNIYYYENYVLK